MVEISARLLVGRASAQDAVSDHHQAVRCGNNGFLRALLRFVALKEGIQKTLRALGPRPRSALVARQTLLVSLLCFLFSSRRCEARLGSVTDFEKNRK
jgi:hypothetical protein